MATKTELITELAELADEIMFDLCRNTAGADPAERAADFGRIFTEVISETLSDESDGFDGNGEHVQPIAVSVLRQVGVSANFPAYEFAERFVTEVNALTSAPKMTRVVYRRRITDSQDKAFAAQVKHAMQAIERLEGVRIELGQPGHRTR